MKKLLFVLCLSCAGLRLFAQIQPSSTGVGDEAAIKKVITDETNMFFAKNREQWATSWVHEPYISWSGQGGGDRVDTQAGWTAYSEMFNGYFNSPSTGSAPPFTFKRDKFQISVVDKAATATFFQTRVSTSGQSLVSREVRVLEKQGADWKLIYVYSRNID